MTTAAARGPAARLRAVALALLLACVAATSPLEFDFGGGLVKVGADGKPIIPSTWKPDSKAATAAAAAAAAAGAAPAAAAAAAAAAGVSPAGTVTPQATASVSAALAPGSSATDPLGAWYDVTWTGATKPMASDRIAVLYTADPDPDQHPRAYFFVTEVANTTWQAGNGKARFWLPLLREAVTFAYLRESWIAPGIWLGMDIIGTKVWNPPSIRTVPHNIRLSVKSSNSVAAIWQITGTAPDAAVRWRIYGSTYTNGTFGTVAATMTTYSNLDMCSSPANDDAYSYVGSIYSAVISNLKPNTRYYYQVGSPTAGWSAEMTFLAAPAAVSSIAETRIILSADVGQYSPDQARYPDGNTFQYLKYMPSDAATPGTKTFAASMAISVTAGAGPGQQPATKLVYDSIVKQMKAKQYHAFISNGDISYARGESHQWDSWGAETLPVTAFLPSLYSVGNHEADDKKYPDSTFTGIDSGGECNVPYRKLLQMPQPSGATSDWFATAFGPIMFIQVNSEQNIVPGSAQYNWLQTTLAAVNRSTTPWLVVGLHRPMYVDTVDSGDQGVADMITNAIEGLLVKYEVDAVWTGHIHAYQRSCIGLMKGRCVGVNATTKAALGPTHVLTGNGGFQSPLNTFDKAPSWLAFSTFEYGFTEVIATRLKMTFRSLATNGTVMDQFDLNKPLNWRPDPTKAAARYANTVPVPKQATFDVMGLYKVLFASFVTNALLDDAWVNKYLIPSSRLWQLVVPPPSNTTVWPIQDVWQVTFPVISLVATKPPFYLNGENLANVQYLYNLIKPGGRLYFGR